MPVDGKWAKEGAKHTAECVHILNENLKTMSSKLDKHHELMLGIMHVPETVVPGTFHASLANLQTTIDKGFTSLHEGIQLYGSKGDDGEPAAKKARVGDTDDGTGLPGADSLEVRAAYARRAARRLISPARVTNRSLYLIACYVAQTST